MPHLRELLGVRRAIVNLFDLAAHQVEWLAGAGPHRVHVGPGMRYGMEFMGDVEALRKGELQFMDVTALPTGPEGEALRASGVHSYIVAPMIARGELIGALSLGGTATPYTPEQLSIVQEVAGQFAIAITQARLHERVRTHAEELERRVRERTHDLEAARRELQDSNAELRKLTLELEHRVAERTRELEVKTEEAKAMSQQLWQAAKLATMGELGASIAHELNNPLATVSLRVETLLDLTPPDDPKHRYLQIIEQETERMARLVASLLEFSRRSHRQISTLDVRAEIESTLELVQHHLRNRAIRVVRAFAADLPAIRADRQQLRQVFLNLFTNASDAMGREGTLTIALSVPGAPNAGPDGFLRQLVIAVTDSGTGIAAADLEKVFEPFYTTKPEGKGTGLGLPICRRIIQEHGGTLALSSAPGQGTTVRITLPL